jgi:site-specific DNA-methyltransferase (adenine-specific)
VPSPYYDHAGITIYHGDCLEILPTLGPVDCVVTDPPYGIAYRARDRREHEQRYRPVRYINRAIAGDDSAFNPAAWLSIGSAHIFWGANHYASRLPDSGGWLVWDKRGGPAFYGKMTFSDCELAWTDIGNTARMYRQVWNGLVREGEEVASRGTGRSHPTQKPLRLMRWCLQKTEGLVLDPYMGSGTTLRAAKDLGRRAIGIEIEERYCEIAAKRLAQEVLPLGVANG